MTNPIEIIHLKNIHTIPIKDLITNDITFKGLVDYCNKKNGVIGYILALNKFRRISIWTNYFFDKKFHLKMIFLGIFNVEQSMIFHFFYIGHIFKIHL